MSDKNEKNGKSRKEELDDFWDLSSLVPKKKYSPPVSRQIDTVEINVENTEEQISDDSSDSPTVIKRYVNPLKSQKEIRNKRAYEFTESYIPENSLLHKVTLKKLKSEYNFHSDFLECAKKYKDAKAEECDFAPYHSFVPQYEQLDEKQLSYYLWWRNCFINGKIIDTELGYILLFIFEIINLGDMQDVKEGQAMLCRLWNEYHSEYVYIENKLATWICDYSLLHRLPPPDNIDKSVIKCIYSFKEFFIFVPKGDYETCTRSMIKYGSEYDYKNSKFYKEDNIPVFDKHIFGAMLTAVRFYSGNGEMFSKISSMDSLLIRRAYEGTLRVSKERYEIEVKYCSFSRSNELRYLMGDIIKYAENKIRTYLGIKSKLSVYSVCGELKDALDEYFENNLLNVPKAVPKKEEKHEYDRLYDLPQKTFSLENAKRIENSSWSVTENLITAFEPDDESVLTLEENIANKNIVEPPKETPQSDTKSEEGLEAALGKYIDFVKSVKNGDVEAYRAFARSLGKLVDAVVDEVNEIALEEIGDVLVEDGENKLEIIECYRNLI